MDLLSQHTQNTSVSPNLSGWRVRIQRNSSKWCSFTSSITSDMWLQTRHNHYWNSALTVHFAQGPTVSKWSTVLKLIKTKTDNAFTAFTIFMKRFVQIPSIVGHHNTMHYLAWNVNGWILLLLLLSSSSSSSADKTNPSRRERVAPGESLR